MKYKIVESVVSQEKIMVYSQLLSLVFSKTNKYTPEYLNWQYCENPNGTIVGSDAYFNNELVAHYATIPVEFSIFGKQTKGLLAVNGATRDDHQGKGLFTKLVNATIEIAKQLKYEFVIGVSNQNSTYVFLKKFNFKLICPLDVKVGIGKIIACNSSIHKIYSNWNDKSLTWRLRNPSARYYRSNKTIVSCTDIPGIYAQLHNGNESCQYISRIERKRAWINLWIGNSKIINKNGIFLDVPNRLRRSPLNLIFKDISDNLPPFNKNDFSFQLIDFDAY